MISLTEGAVRLVYYHHDATNHLAPLKRIVSLDDGGGPGLAAAQALVTRPAAFQGAFRADVEQVIAGHWSLVARRWSGRKYQVLTAPVTLPITEA